MGIKVVLQSKKKMRLQTQPEVVKMRLTGRLAQVKKSLLYLCHYSLSQNCWPTATYVKKDGKVNFKLGEETRNDV